jgi:beta-1,4-mannosyltransferase
MYEMRAQELSVRGSTDRSSTEGKLPKLLVVVTGKGPLRDHYMKEISALQEDWKWVRCISLWLEAADYPTMLGIHSSLRLSDASNDWDPNYRFSGPGNLPAF